MDVSKQQNIQDTKSKLWDVSFEKIIKIFPNIKEIHFVNDYKFDNEALQKLINQIEKTDNKLHKVKFIYYDYDQQPTDCRNFFPPSELLEDKIYELTNICKWELKHKQTNVGYK